LAIELTIKNSNINIEGKSSQVDLHKELLKGDDGFSPVVEVIETEGGHTVAITDAEGRKEFEVKNGEGGVAFGSKYVAADYEDGLIAGGMLAQFDLWLETVEAPPEDAIIYDIGIWYGEEGEEPVEYRSSDLYYSGMISSEAAINIFPKPKFDDVWHAYCVAIIVSSNIGGFINEDIANYAGKTKGFTYYYMKFNTGSTPGGDTPVAVAPSDWNAAEGEPGYIANKPFEGTIKEITWDGKTDGLDTVDLLGMATLYKVSDDYFDFREEDIAAGKYSIYVGEPTADGIEIDDSANLKEIWGTDFDETNTFQVISGNSFAVFPYFASVAEDNTTFSVDCSSLGFGIVDVVIEKAGTYFTTMDGMAIGKASYVDVISQIPLDFIPEEAFCTAELQDYGNYSRLSIIDRNGKIQSTYIYDGQQGATFTPSISYDGILSWRNDRGLTNPNPIKIVGADGAPGYTPEKGKDYYTEADKQEFYDYIDTNILGGEW
jgi:hypothetical protein